MSEYEHGPRTTAEARDALATLVAWAFGRTDKPAAFTIPCDQRRDADCVLSDVIEERDRLRAALRALLAALPECDAGQWTDRGCDAPGTYRAIGGRAGDVTFLCDAHASLAPNAREVLTADAIRTAMALLTAAVVRGEDNEGSNNG